MPITIVCTKADQIDVVAEELGFGGASGSGGAGGGGKGGKGSWEERTDWIGQVLRVIGLMCKCRILALMPQARLTEFSWAQTEPLFSTPPKLGRRPSPFSALTSFIVCMRHPSSHPFRPTTHSRPPSRHRPGSHSFTEPTFSIENRSSSLRDGIRGERSRRSATDSIRAGSSTPGRSLFDEAGWTRGRMCLLERWMTKR